MDNLQKNGPDAAVDGNDLLDIPDGVLVACPLKRYAQVRAGAACVVCPHFAGLADRFPGGSQPFNVRYLVRCAAEPVQRPLSQLAEG